MVKDCPITSEDGKRKLLTEYRQNKERYAEKGKCKGKKGDEPNVGRAARLTGSDLENHSTLFSASFYNGAVESLVLADPGSDANMLPLHVLEELLKVDPSLHVTTLNKALSFTMACSKDPEGSEINLKCNRSVVADLCLRIRHGTKLMMRGMKWAVSDTATDTFLSGAQCWRRWALTPSS